MFEKLIGKFKKTKVQVSTSPVAHLKEQTSTFEIKLSRQNNFFKMEISDYVSLIDYYEKMNQIDTFGLDAMICNSVSWNSRRQKINKGTYFVIVSNNRLYNILISDEHLIIDERTKVEEVTEERVIKLENNEYWCSFFKHDITGNTFFNRYFNTSGFSIGALDLTKEEAIETFRPVIENLRNIDGIDDIIDPNIFDSPDQKTMKKI